MTPRKSVHYDPDAHPGGDDGGPMFGKKLVRRSDPATSHAAADAIAPHLTGLRRKVFGAFVLDGPMTAKECERLPEFRGSQPSTVRKRVSECLHLGLLADTGLRRDGCAVLRVGK